MNRVIPEFSHVVNTLADQQRYMKDIVMLFLSNKSDGWFRTKAYPKGTVLYRARKMKVNEVNTESDKNNGFFGFKRSGCLEPPPEKTSEGRCNRKGKPVLYLALDKYTALIEICPSKREHVSISCIELQKDVNVVDLSYIEDPSNTNDYNELCFYFYLQFGSAYGYAITQSFSMCFDEMGYDGLLFSSSVSEKGENIVIFQKHIRDVCHVVSSELFMVGNMLCYATNEYKAEQRLTPTSICNVFSQCEIDYFFQRMSLNNPRQ